MNPITLPTPTTLVAGVVIEYSKIVCNDELHVIIHVDKQVGLKPFPQQVQAVLSGIASVNSEFEDFTPIFGRFFLSDAANQQEHLLSMTKELLKETAISIVEQPPLDGTKIALWLWLRKGISKRCLDDGIFEISDGCNKHYFASHQSGMLLPVYAEKLKDLGLSLRENCIRTWFFVQNIDVNYAAIVKERNDVFAKENLTRDTHFIASTGIGGRAADWQTKVLMDAYAVEGLKPEQITYLKALTHLSPTADYGVAFERGTKVSYSDRSHIFISGTASIDHQGKVLHTGDIRKQTERMMENVAALLAEANCQESDIMQIIVYLRDISDRHVVEEIIKRRYPYAPKIFTYARVCRYGWLVEMECIAAHNNISAVFSKPDYQDFILS